MASSAPPSRNIYEHPELARWAGSMEGVPEWVGPTETFEERASREPWQQRGNELFALLGALLPGIAIALALAVLGQGVSESVGTTLMGLEKSPISPILIAIVAGLLIRNTIGLPVVYESGLQLCLKRLLRVGVALLGIRLSLGAVGAIGLAALPIVVGCIATALLLVSWVNARLGMPRRLGTLVAVGTAICGNTAIVATGPVIDADEDEVSYAVGTITVFGLLALVTYPFVSHALFGGDAGLAGFFLGTAIHDTAQVAGAGLLYVQQYAAPQALDTATVTKLVRNVFMVAVIPLMAVLYHRTGDAQGRSGRPPLKQAVPLFVFGFVAMALLRTVGDLGDAPFGGLLSASQWSSAIASLSTLSAWCLTVAMASVGLGTNLKRLRSLGLKPLGVGLAAALSVGLMSTLLIHLLASWLTRVA
ncbi:MAG: putative sulfate exporter family transporter [Myxococcota bacterium]|nr:putative sulfate exporter family transporter [Myxococcota bacterium]